MVQFTNRVNSVEAIENAYDEILSVATKEFTESKFYNKASYTKGFAKLNTCQAFVEKWCYDNSERLHGTLIDLNKDLNELKENLLDRFMSELC